MVYNDNHALQQGTLEPRPLWRAANSGSIFMLNVLCGAKQHANDRYVLCGGPLHSADVLQCFGSFRVSRKAHRVLSKAVRLTCYKP
jgi:hypothetical protein